MGRKVINLDLGHDMTNSDLLFILISKNTYNNFKDKMIKTYLHKKSN